MGNHRLVSPGVGGIEALHLLLRETPHLAADVWILGRVSLDDVTTPVMLRVFWELCERATPPGGSGQENAGQPVDGDTTASAVMRLAASGGAGIQTY
ncbi:hypothetical protein HHJ78_02555 [Mobiluncus mulieris]|uniref:Uncharacterized protein n=1 Tax=Mobiluncus mulieris TaxID=2052 RepID=A0A7Y0TZZ6_9ACTO|nr:hypothetical protein [Mobiluncus mulieris]NMW64436.1 hypothetical protein [Mobiluncus mulieris]